MVEQRNPILVVLFTLITLGVYGIYWFYMTSQELIEETGQDSSAVLWLIGLLIPLVNFLVIWKYTAAVENASGEHSGPLLFVLWVVFMPAAQYLVQSDINALG
ncbi:MAG: DUF4234 domain-containing protein [Candidatus Nanohaloarchaeota archaeon QJJ-7]|nr:DUF4234 domain-containing protein [Candidatus Nanohaloarchaeota archaeon QJJ-7]